MIKAVIFDMGGVIQTYRATPQMRLDFASQTLKMLAQRGLIIEDSPEVFEAKLAAANTRRKAHTERTLCEIPPLECWTEHFLKEYGATQEQLFPIAEALCYGWNRHRGVDTPRDGLKGCLTELYADGMRLGIISNTISRTYVPERLSAYGVSGYFEYVLLSSVCGLRKPDPAIFALLERSMCLKKEELAYVGDTYSRDVTGTRRAGWRLMIRINHPQAEPHVKEREQRHRQTGLEPDHVVDSLSEIPALIRRHNAAT